MRNRIRAPFLTIVWMLSLGQFPEAAEDPLHILQANNIDRLRLDFNASGSKVRLVLMLSPT